VTARFRAAVSVLDVTPPRGFPLGGYILRTGVSEGVLDPITARLLFLASGKDKLLFITLDWVNIDGRWARELREAVEKRTGIAGERIVVVATHTHSGPEVLNSPEIGEGEQSAYFSDVCKRIVGAVAGLVDSARDVEAFLGSTRVTGIGAHRNDPKLPVDNELSCLTLRASDGADVCRLVVYGCHPTLLGPENLLFSADWVGRGLAEVDRRWGGTSLFINGAAGDVSTRFVRKARGAYELQKYAAIFSDAVGRARNGSAPLPDARIGTKTIHVPVSYRELPDPEQAQQALITVERRIIEGRERNQAYGEIRRLESIREAAIVSFFLTSAGGFEKIFGARPMIAPVSMVRIGSADMVLLPGEVMSETAVSLKAAADGVLFVCGYANDYFGYLSHGRDDYEASMRLLSSDSVTGMIDAARRLVTEGV
jgi:neutral ceramidase